MTQSEADRLKKEQNILWVEEDIMFEASEGILENEIDEFEKMAKFARKESGAYFAELNTQWNTDVINANEEEYLQTDDRIKVAILDTGICASDDIDVVEHVNFIEGEEDVNMTLIL